ncbi:hypothetical protein HYQ46_002874 [Verticillium longisporum]|nr:hypothetical protein HYQ46_002874 [Verticillium longisporum]
MIPPRQEKSGWTDTSQLQFLEGCRSATPPEPKVKGVKVESFRWRDKGDSDTLVRGDGALTSKTPTADARIKM